MNLIECLPQGLNTGFILGKTTLFQGFSGHAQEPWLIFFLSQKLLTNINTKKQISTFIEKSVVFKKKKEKIKNLLKRPDYDYSKVSCENEKNLPYYSRCFLRLKHLLNMMVI